MCRTHVNRYHFSYIVPLLDFFASKNASDFSPKAFYLPLIILFPQYHYNTLDSPSQVQTPANFMPIY